MAPQDVMELSRPPVRPGTAFEGAEEPCESLAAQPVRSVPCVELDFGAAGDCRTGAADASEGGRIGPIGCRPCPVGFVGSPETKPFVVPRDGVEPPTRGFSILCSTN